MNVKHRNIAFAVILLMLLSLQPAYTYAAEQVGTGIIATVESDLNVRKGPSINYDVIAKLPKDTHVDLYKLVDDWWYIGYYTDKSGDAVHSADSDKAVKYEYGYSNETYIYESYLQKYIPVSIDLPDYKQYDSEWGRIIVGKSGQNIKNIGCTVTCVAMVESYRKNEVVTPADIAATFSFTGGGAIYWTAVYNPTYTSDYLITAYNELVAGNPVLIESKNKYGTSHWVVINGFRGGELTAENFLINDPASTDRKTLADYFEAYPNYSKIIKTKGDNP
jgi:uncharacterized protein YraI